LAGYLATLNQVFKGSMAPLGAESKCLSKSVRRAVLRYVVSLQVICSHQPK